PTRARREPNAPARSTFSNAEQSSMRAGDGGRALAALGGLAATIDAGVDGRRRVGVPVIYQPAHGRLPHRAQGERPGGTARGNGEGEGRGGAERVNGERGKFSDDQ